MIRITQVKMPLSHTQDELIGKAASLLHINKESIIKFKIVKKSIDARKKPDIYLIYTLDLTIQAEEKLLKRIVSNGHKRQPGFSSKMQIGQVDETAYSFPESGMLSMRHRPVIVGTGPAGLFCGYFLALHGYRPILLERGKDVESRRKDVEDFWRGGILRGDSNVQFGEGGAGTFSDGKLNTLVKDKNGRNREVLQILVRMGAPESILYEAKPHIGTDILMNVVRNLREEILHYGGEIHFASKVTDILTDKEGVVGVVINDAKQIRTDVLVLAIGHSARDTFQMLYDRKVPMDAKAFAVGIRVEHPRKMINRLQYGKEEHPLLPTADYKVTAQTNSGRGVYSFCMCPGGYVVNASSEAGRLAVNGMSYSGRDGVNSNSAVIVTVTPKDFESDHPLAGVEFQRKLEEKAYEAGKGQVPVECYTDFRKAVCGRPKEASDILKAYPDFVPQIKGNFCFAPVHRILPKELNDSLIEGMERFDRILPGFADGGVYLSGIESRTSSPVRIHRDETGQSAVKGLYPCGEGAGYAGGITSAAMDGILIAEKIAAKYARI